MKPRGKVLNMRSVTDDQFKDATRIDRTTKWGNPFVIGKDGTREEVIKKYRSYLVKGLRYGKFTHEELAALHGHDLLCWCAPEPCHGDVLIAQSGLAVKMLEVINERRI